MAQLTAHARQHFALTEDWKLFVDEVASTVSGCQTPETLITFWITANNKHSFRIYKPVTDVTAKDFPPLLMQDGFKCEGICCC